MGEDSMDWLGCWKWTHGGQSYETRPDGRGAFDVWCDGKNLSDDEDGASLAYDALAAELVWVVGRWRDAEERAAKRGDAHAEGWKRGTALSETSSADQPTAPRVGSVLATADAEIAALRVEAERWNALAGRQQEALRAGHELIERFLAERAEAYDRERLAEAKIAEQEAALDLLREQLDTEGDLKRGLAGLEQVVAEQDAALAAAGLTFEAIRSEPEMADEYAPEVLLDSCRTLAEQALEDKTVARAVELDAARREVCSAWRAYRSAQDRYQDDTAMPVSECGARRRELLAADSRLAAMEAAQ